MVSETVKEERFNMDNILIFMIFPLKWTTNGDLWNDVNGILKWWKTQTSWVWLIMVKKVPLLLYSLYHKVKETKAY